MSLATAAGCGGDDAGGNGSESSSSETGEQPGTTAPPTTTTGASATTPTTGEPESSGPSPETGDSESSTGEPIEDPGVPPSCGECSVSSPTSVGVAGSPLLNPGRVAGPTGDGRMIAASHDYDDAVIASVLDPDAGTWGSPVAIRDPGEWNSEEYTELAVVPTQGGAVVLEHANGDLFAHRLAGDTWTHVELTEVPGFRYLEGQALAPDGRIAVLVRSNTAWDQPESLTLAWFDPATDTWTLDPYELVMNPQGGVELADLLIDSDDGDIYVTMITGPEVGVYPRIGLLKRRDGTTGEWSNVWGDMGFIFWLSMRELEPGELVFSPSISEVPEQSYFVAADGTLGPATDMPFPQDYADGTLRRVYFGYESYDGQAADTISYHTYTREDFVGETDVLDVYGTTAAVDISNTRTMAAGGRGYAMWSTFGGPPSLRVAVHDADGWTDSIIVGTPSNPIGPTQLAVGRNGDAFAAWSPACQGGPCANDPTTVAGYTASDDCWHEGRALVSGADAYAYDLPETTGFLVTTVGSGYEARFMHCE